ncbi:hypothetical protein TanjilG_00348 [Lupinus angustifolius]|uniref:Peroxidase n=1 Tax=Lupinus angustifolius TaxID=3871 RepID=A0A1J7GPH1_LUPAN|nr:PREDICTED: peroxidase 51-like [Lupinus angustifolius]OIV90002.1 hypothetical protein TanjilG_00348 [Lupinus angustifolius]
MGRLNLKLMWSLTLISLCLYPYHVSGVLSTNHYANICPNLETIVRQAVQKKFQQTFVTIPSTLRLFFHDCFVQGCDASVMIASTANNKAEKDSSDNLSLAGDGFDTVIKAKAAVDAVPQCRNKVSCADILALATRDVVALGGGPSYSVELGRFDGLVSRASDVTGRLPQPEFKLNQLNTLFASNGLTQTDMVALSGAHTLGFSHCDRLSSRIYSTPVDPSLNKQYATQLQQMCPRNVDPRIAINMDPTTSKTFDNVYYKNLQQGKGLFTSDQILFTDQRSRATVNSFASNSNVFNQNFITAITKLGRVGVKNASNGKIRTDCSVL